MAPLVKAAHVTGIVAGAIIAIATLVGMVNNALLEHLDHTFVNKVEFHQEFERVNQKLDDIKSGTK